MHEHNDELQELVPVLGTSREEAKRSRVLLAAYLVGLLVALALNWYVHPYSLSLG